MFFHKRGLTVACGYVLSPRDGTDAMTKSLKTYAIHAWTFVCDHSVRPLRHIPGICSWYYALQVLGRMWTVSFSLKIGSYSFLATNILRQSVLMAAAAVTAAAVTVVAKRPKHYAQCWGFVLTANMIDFYYLLVTI